MALPPPTASTPELRTLAGTRLLSEQGAELLGPGKPLALLVYLACSPRFTASREHLIDLLWSDLPADKARHTLRQALWYLRRILPDGLAVQGDEITLVQRIRFDRDEFLDAARREDLDQLLAIYQQEFLSGFALPGSVEFEQWADVERAQLSALFLRAAEQASRKHLDAGRFTPAIALARRVRDAAPARERGWRLLLEALVAAQDPVGFALEATALTTRLAQEERQPEPATRSLLDRMTRADLLPATQEISQALTPALVGRSREFATIVEAWGTARLQRGRHLHLEGAAGLGKSRLLADIHHRLRGRGARTVQVRATPADRTIPYSLAAEVARALAELPGASGVSTGSAATLVGLNPSLSSRFAAAPDTATGSEALRRRATALIELLVAVLEEQPVAILLDDLHWADPASLQCLRPMLERVHAIPALILTAARPVPGLTLPEGAEVLVVPPLTREQVTELLASLAPLPDAPWANALPGLLHRNSGGVPLLLLETLQLARERARLLVTAQGWECPDWDGLRRQLEAEIGLRQRVADLPPEPGRALLALAVAGQPLAPAETARVLGWDIGAIQQALGQLELRGLAHQSTEQWQPAHDEIGKLAIDLAEPGARRALHKGLGELLAARASSPRDLVRAGHHLALAEHWPGLRQVFLDYLRRQRREGDHRRIRFIASDFLEGVPDTLVDDLLTRLGRLNVLRYELARPAVGIAAIAFVGVGLALSALTRAPDPDAILWIRDLQAPQHSGLIAIPVTREGWRSDQPVDLATLPRLPAPEYLADGLSTAIRPGGDIWAITRTSPDSAGGGTQIQLHDPHGKTTVVGSAKGDYNVASWLPDGSGLIINTGEWSGGFYDLAVLSLDGQVRRLTTYPNQDGAGYVSPDGTRVLFERGGLPGGSTICLRGLDSLAEEHCLEGSGDGVSPIGWANNQTILIQSRKGGEGLSVLELLTWETGRRQQLMDGIEAASPSPDARWLAYSRLLPGRSSIAWFVAPMANPTDARELLGFRNHLYLPVWQVNRPAPYVARLELSRPGGPIPAHTGYQFLARGIDQDQHEISLSASLRWRSTDTTIASIDATGWLSPRHEGRTLVVAELPGWRADTVPVVIQATPSTVVFEEQWEHGASNWVVFGEPAPAVIGLPDGRHAFWNRGDGIYTSGAFTRTAWRGALGFGAEFTLSVPLNDTHWQRAYITVGGGLDSTLPPVAMERGGAGLREVGTRSCEMGFPATEGVAAMNRLAIGIAGIVMPPVPAPFRGDGHWVRWRIQIFPDGTCGVAVNGTPLWRSRLQIALDRPMGLAIFGASAQTKVLHGAIMAWTGVRDDIDWGAVRTHEEGDTSTPGPAH